MTPAKPKLIKKRDYTPILSALERKAYHAAHRDRLACPGGRRSAAADHIARIITEIFTEVGK